MLAHAKSLIIKADEHVQLAERHLEEESQHDLVGYNLAQACEKFLKALCEMKNLEYPHDEEGHDLDGLMQILEEANFSAISSHADIIDLTAYNSTTAYVRLEDRLDLDEMMKQTKSLKKLVGEQLSIH